MEFVQFLAPFFRGRPWRLCGLMGSIVLRANFSPTAALLRICSSCAPAGRTSYGVSYSMRCFRPSVFSA
jgi:hypothetical protein